MKIEIKQMETDAEIKGKAYVHWKAWHEAYPGMVDRGYLDALTLETCEEKASRWRDNLLVAKIEDRVIGFVGYGDRGAEAPDTGEIFALYVLSEYYGTGVARQLMQAGLERLKQYPQVCLWVLKENKRAIRFYQKCGFVPDGEELFSERINAAEIRMIRKHPTLMMQNVFFINGTAYAGKSTMVKLLAQKYDGIACEENYHDRLLPELDPAEFPCLCYTRDLQDWHDFIRRTPEEYEAWYDGVTVECERLELRILSELDTRGRPVFVDTNIRPETLKTISDRQHVLIMLADPEISVRRFFDRPDREKQFLYQLILEEPDPEKAMETYRQGLQRINSQARYDRFLHSGFSVLTRDEQRSVEQTLNLVEQVFGLSSR